MFHWRKITLFIVTVQLSNSTHTRFYSLGLWAQISLVQVNCRHLSPETFAVNINDLVSWACYVCIVGWLTLSLAPPVQILAIGVPSACRARCVLMKLWQKTCKEGTATNQRRSGSEGHRFETLWEQGLFTMESPLKIYLSSRDMYTDIKSCARSIGWLYICLAWDRCDMSSKNKISTWVVASIKKIIDRTFEVLWFCELGDCYFTNIMSLAMTVTLLSFYFNRWAKY